MTDKALIEAAKAFITDWDSPQNTNVIFHVREFKAAIAAIAAAQAEQPKKLPTQEEIDNGPHAGLGNIPSDYAEQSASATSVQKPVAWLRHDGVWFGQKEPIYTRASARCPFKRCHDQVVHCNGACHGLAPDGSRLTEIPELADHIDDTVCIECQGVRPCSAGPFCVALEAQYAQVEQARKDSHD